MPLAEPGKQSSAGLTVRKLRYRGTIKNDAWLHTRAAAPNLRRLVNLGLAHGYEPDAARIGPLLPPGTPPGTAFAGPERPAGHVDTTWINPSTEWAAGGIVSTAKEWARFDSALVSGKLLAPEQLKEMLTTVAEGPGNPNRYGLGLERVVTPCGTVWGHVGQVPGYSSWDFTDSTGSRTASVFASSVFDLAEPKTGAAVQTLVDAAVCTMFGKPVPGGEYEAG